MSGNRKAAQEEILNCIELLLPGGENKKLYENMFAKMSNTDFEQFIEDLKTNKKRLSIIQPNFAKYKLTVERNFQLAERWGHDFFQQIWIPEKGECPAYLSPIKYLVVILPVRRQAQLLDKKISIPEDNNSVDDFTGQPTGKSKGSKISFPEVNVMAAQGLDSSLEEFLKYRGGDEKGFNAMNTMISRTGGWSMKAIEPYAGTVKSTHTLSIMLTGMHLRNTLLNK